MNEFSDDIRAYYEDKYYNEDEDEDDYDPYAENGFADESDFWRWKEGLLNY